MTRRTRTVVAAGAAVCATVLVGCQPANRSGETFGWVDPPPTVQDVTVTRVIDGDTVEVDTAEGVTQRVRMVGIDTPETKRPDTPVQCWGPEATTFARELLDGQRVTMRDDPRVDLVDDYGRLVRYLVLPDGREYSVAAAEAGAARAYVYDDTRPPQLADEIAAAQDRAEAAGLGLWGPPCHGGL